MSADSEPKFGAMLLHCHYPRFCACAKLATAMREVAMVLTLADSEPKFGAMLLILADSEPKFGAMLLRSLCQRFCACAKLAISLREIADGSSDRYGAPTKGAVSNAKLRAFEAALFLCIEAKIPKIKKKPQNEAKKSMTKRGSAKSSFLRAIQFRKELV